MPHCTTFDGTLMPRLNMPGANSTRPVETGTGNCRWEACAKLEDTRVRLDPYRLSILIIPTCSFIVVSLTTQLLGGGLWNPEPQHLAAMRRLIDEKPHRLINVLLDPGIREYFFDGVANDKEKVVAAFVRHNQDNALKTKPKVSLRQPP